MKWIYKYLYIFFEHIMTANKIVQAHFYEKQLNPISEDYRVYTKPLKNTEKCSLVQTLTEYILNAAHSLLIQAGYCENRAELVL